MSSYAVAGVDEAGGVEDGHAVAQRQTAPEVGQSRRNRPGIAGRRSGPRPAAGGGDRRIGARRRSAPASPGRA